MKFFEEHPPIFDQKKLLQRYDEQLLGSAALIENKRVEVRAEIGDLESQIARSIREDHAGRNTTESNERKSDGSLERFRAPSGLTERLEKEKERKKAEKKEYDRQAKDNGLERGGVLQPIRLIDNLARKSPPLIFSDAKLETLRKGESEVSFLSRMTGAIESAKEEKAAVSKGRRTPDEAKAAAREYAEKKARLGEPEVITLFNNRGEAPRWPTFFVDFTPRVDAMAVLAWLHKDALIEALEKAIDDAAAVEGGTLSATERAERIADLDSVIFSAESAYEKVWFELAAKGVFVPRRRNAEDVRPIVGLSIEQPFIPLKR